MLGKFTIGVPQPEPISIFAWYWLLCFHWHLVVTSIVVHHTHVVHDFMSKEFPLQLANPYHSHKHPPTHINDQLHNISNSNAKLERY
jgi:hypothetical protein